MNGRLRESTFTNEPPRQSEAAQAPSAPAQLEVAYHAGPSTITFAGRMWYLGQRQAVTPELWSAMQARSDFPHFDFRTA